MRVNLEPYGIISPHVNQTSDFRSSDFLENKENPFPKFASLRRDMPWHVSTTEGNPDLNSILPTALGFTTLSLISHSTDALKFLGESTSSTIQLISDVTTATLGAISAIYFVTDSTTQYESLRILKTGASAEVLFPESPDGNRP